MTAEKTYLRTDTGNAERLVDRFGHDPRYCEAKGTWYVWDGRRWLPGRRLWIVHLASRTVQDLFDEVRKAKSEDERKALGQHAVRSNSQPRIIAMVELAKADRRIQVSPDQLDAQPMLLNLPNGTLHLDTGEFQKHDRCHYITKLAGVQFIPDAPCPRWRDFLARIFDPQEDLIRFVQRAVGYALTGSAEEEALFFLYGTGANGKTTFEVTILDLLGEYGRQADFSTFTAKSNNGAPRNDLARLHGARLVCASETSRGRKFDEALIKQVTGRDRVSCRFLYGEFFEYVPQYKLFLAANHKPKIEGTEEAIWRRICLIPFRVTIPKAERDKKLGAKLLEELPGILNWALEGCLEWQRQGLNEPREVTTATRAYREEMDPIGDFLAQRCAIGAEGKVKSRDLYCAYEDFCTEKGEEPVARNRFGELLGERGFQKASIGGARGWAGVSLKEA